MDKHLTRISKFLSLILRHSPETIHVSMDANGWVYINEIITNAEQYKHLHLTIDVIKAVVASNDKQRFKISDDGKKIRANQGHSVQVDLELEPQTPPDILYHGTAKRFLDSILQEGLKPMSREYVHLSQTQEMALAVGKRHGEPIILTVDAKTMNENGCPFYFSENKVWLVKEVPVAYLKIDGGK
jgi:putative RNA 2'-phosphotransferase